MKILWVSPFFLHPTDRGGQIRTLGTLRELHKRHEIHFAALNPPSNTEGPTRSMEYCSKHIVIQHTAPRRESFAIIPQLLSSIFSPIPLAVSRYASKELRATLQSLVDAEHYDSIVCDFLASAPNLPDLGQCVLFQHNVETTIWDRHVERSQGVKRHFFALQANKMRAYEAEVCKSSRFVIAVSEMDAARMRSMFAIEHVKSVATGVDLQYFRRPTGVPITQDILFCGSMDWLPNVDAMEFFLLQVLPLIRAERPATTVTIAGRSPDERVLKAAEGLSGVLVTGSVPDMRPYLWGSKISVVPIRIGGGTRLKIYECMAAGLPVVSTTIGAEGLSFENGEDILIADTAGALAASCLRLLADPEESSTFATAALHLVESRFSWSAVTADFEAILENSSNS